MAHRTRKRLTKQELRRDPVAERLYEWWSFSRTHTTQLILGGVAVIAAIAVMSSLLGRSRAQELEAMAGYLTAELIYEQAEQQAASGSSEQAVQALQAAWTVAGEVASQHRNRIWGRRAALLSARLGILMGRNEEVISSMQELLAAQPPREVSNQARLHLAVALENRGGVEDLQNAYTRYSEILESAPPTSVIRAEAMEGLARLEMRSGDYAAARGWLDGALEVLPDTSMYIRHLLTTIEWAEREHPSAAPQG
ncbi:hypothetical protein JW921_04070 [Candidatus Fermentibacterales bacterium]|nr:hypothetical protein [Candidatus Fermentibacterales bacterium]